MTPNEALKWADTFGPMQSDPPSGDAPALMALAAEVRRMRHRIEFLRGGLKYASGKFFEIGEHGAAEDCMEWSGDMEPPIMGSNT